MLEETLNEEYFEEMFSPASKNIKWKWGGSTRM